MFDASGNLPRRFMDGAHQEDCFYARGVKPASKVASCARGRAQKVT